VAPVEPSPLDPPVHPEASVLLDPPVSPHPRVHPELLQGEGLASKVAQLSKQRDRLIEVSTGFRAAGDRRCGSYMFLALCESRFCM
jgi:hypothetical protein